MTNKKISIVYWLSDNNHSRVFESFVENDRFEQVIIKESHVTRTHDIKINKILQYHSEDIVSAIEIVKPDVFVQTDDSRKARKYLRKKNIKHVYLMHGLWPPKSPKSYTMSSHPFWTNYDLLCGGTKGFKDLFDGKTSGRVITNTLTQFDVLYNHMQNQHRIRKNLLQKSEVPNAEKIITLFGHNIKTRESLLPHHEGYFRSAVKLAELAEKYNWLLCIKTKAPWSRSSKYIKNNINKLGWARELCKQYLDLEKRKNVTIIAEHGDQYDLFCSDVIIGTAHSTIEIESILVNKPLIRVCMARNKITEEYENEILDSGAAYIVDDIDKLEKTVILAMTEDNKAIKKNRTKFIKHLGLTCDGKSHERILEEIHRMVVIDKQKGIQSEIWRLQPEKTHKRYLGYPDTRGKKMVEYFGNKNISSMFEVGCSSGRNLRYLNKNMPNVKLGALEINEHACRMARQNVPDAIIHEMNLHDMNIDDKYDVVFTGGVLMHVTPGDIMDVIKKCIHKANRYVVHMEPVGNDCITNGPKEFNPASVRKMLKCLHDIKKVYSDIGLGDYFDMARMSNGEQFIVVEVPLDA